MSDPAAQTALHLASAPVPAPDSEARAAPAAGAEERRAERERIKERWLQERREREADPEEQAERAEMLARVRGDAAEARRALAAGAPERAAERERIKERRLEERRREADPAERAARDGVVARARRDADEARASLRRRLDAAPGARRTSPRRPWAPLSDDEWAVLSPFVLRAAAGPGRPVRDPRGRLDAIFWLAARPQRHLPPWRELPEALSGRRDTVARQSRRWARAGLWTRLLEALADPEYPGTAVLRRLESWICRTFRRAWRILGTAGVVLARGLGFLSALRAPSVFLPDPDLSHSVKSTLRRLRDRFREGGEAALRRGALPCPDWFRVAHALLRDATGGRRISRHMAWP